VSHDNISANIKAEICQNGVKELQYYHETHLKH